MNSNLDPQNESHELAHVTTDEHIEYHHGDENDFADYNQNEVEDYHLDSSFEERTELCED